MGLCASAESKLSPEEREKDKQAKIRSRNLERKAENEHFADQLIHKMLLLGAGESGKSTLFKQMVALYGTGFTDEERRQYPPIIHNNVVTSLQTLIKYSDTYGSPVQCAEAMEYVREMAQDAPITKANEKYFKALVADPGIQATILQRSKFQLLDSANHFFGKISQIAVDNYIPDDQDILWTRVRTTGIVEHAFSIDGAKFKIFDVGGQRNERKKWIHCFEGVMAVLFVGVLSEYDLVLYEDETMNRLQETLSIFDDICNSKWFTNTAMILFLNKRDLFQVKIQTVPLTVCPAFKDYKGDNSFEAGVAAIEKKFQALNRNPSKIIHTHVISAVDTGLMANVLRDVSAVVVKSNSTTQPLA
jgi:GTPase SAR1 family protein